MLNETGYVFSGVGAKCFYLMLCIIVSRTILLPFIDLLQSIEGDHVAKELLLLHGQFTDFLL